MSEFTTIETPEQFEKAIEERLTTERELVGKKYEGYLSPDDLNTKAIEYEKKIEELKRENEGHSKKITERDQKLKAYEVKSVKAKVAQEMGLSHKAVDFMQGEDEETIKKSAEALKAIMGKQSAPPLATTETGDKGGTTDEALRQTLRKLKGE